MRAEQIAETPLSGRRASQVAQLAPGVVGGNMGGSVPTGVGTFATGVTSINGGRADEFMTTIDGAPSIRVRAAGGFMMGAQNFDTVAEVQVLTTNYQAEYGRSSAGQLRLVTKSGTQSFRGNVFWSHQNDALDANTWTRKRAGLEKSPHKYNAYGFTLGGPIYIPGAFNDDKQKLFFFWGQEWQRDRTVEEQTAIVPTAAMRNGDFSALLPARVIRDPLTGLPFPGNVIPQGRISPQGRALLNAFPLPTPGFQQGANNWIGNPSVFNNQRKDSIKIDWVPTSNHRVAVRHTWAPNVWNDPEPMGVYSTIWDYPGRTLAATLTSTLSSTRSSTSSRSRGDRPARRSTSGSATATTARAAPTRSCIRRRSRSASTIRTCSPARSSTRTRFRTSRCRASRRSTTPRIRDRGTTSCSCGPTTSRRSPATTRSRPASASSDRG